MLLLAAPFAAPLIAPLPPEIEDEQCLGVNKIPYHSTLVPYGSPAEALKGDRTKSSFARSLNGPWRFHWVPRPEARPADFYKPGYDVSGWKTIPVPSNVEVQGYGTPIYTNITYPFKADWPTVTHEPPKDWTMYEERDAVSSYRRTFTVPAAWKGRETFLKFDGVDAGFFLWINGQKVGYSQNSRNAAEFDVTKYLRPGKNDVAVEVYRLTAGSYLEDQDMWRMSGIFRNVTLWSAPKLHVQDTFVTTDLDSEYKDATLKVVTKVHNYGTTATKAQALTTTLYDASGKPVGAPLRGSVPSISPGAEKSVTLSGKVRDPKKWTAEGPNLYTAVLRLGKEEILSHRVGFRKVEIKGRVFMVNGKPVKLKGANRHEMSPETGYHVTEADMVRDLTMLKRANANHVRTSHYSDDPRWYELCDEWGIYLVAEANLESHGLYNVIDREPRFERMIVDRNVANVENFKNHPSVLIWSMGNECGGGSNLRAAEAVVRAMDPTRPTHYEAFGEGANNPASIDSHMYTQPAELERIAKNETLTKPMYLCEYAHAMNNSMGAMGEYNDVFDKYPALMGGAVWEWEDQGLWNRRDPAHPYLAYGGGFGDKPNDHFFIHKGVVFSDRSPKPHFPEMKRAYQWIAFRDEGGGRITVRNRYNDTDLSKYDFSWSLVSERGPVAKGTIPGFSLAPGEERTLTLDLPKDFDVDRDARYLNVAASLRTPERWAEKGYEIANAQFAVPGRGSYFVPTARGELDLTEDAGGIRVAGDGFAVAFSKSTGTISKLEENGRDLLLSGGGPRPHLWRAQHRNDDGWAAGGWKAADLMDLKPEVLGLTAEPRVYVDAKKPYEVAVTASVRYVGANGFSVLHLARFTVRPDGTILVDNGLSPEGGKITLARMGVRMLLDPKMESLKYFARGPMENYIDRKRGSDLGLYASTVTEQMTPYPKPQECGNHEDLSWLALKDGATTLTAAAVDAPLQFSALPYTDEQMEDVPYRTFLPERTATALILGAKTLGVGSASCGPRPEPNCRVDTTPMAFSYVLSLGKAEPGPYRGTRSHVEPILVSRSADGRTTLVSNHGIETSPDGEKWTAYTSPMVVEKPTRLYARTVSLEGERDVFTGVVALEPPPAKLLWKATASSFEAGEGDAAHAIDNDPTTFWHSKWSGTAAKPPHALTIDLGKSQTFGSVVLTPRGDGANGRIRDYEIYLSDDGRDWGTPVAKGRLANRGEPQTVRLAREGRGRYLKLVVLSDQANDGLATLAEIDVR